MADQYDTLRILPLAIECDRLLTRFVAGTESSDSMQASELSLNTMRRIAKDWQERFNAWSSYLGVFADDSISLDRRLFDHPDIRVMIIKLLETLRLNLELVIATSRDSSSEDVFFHSKDESKFVEGSIDRLHRLGVTIRRSSMASLRARVDAFADKSKFSFEELCSKAIKSIYPLAPGSLQELLIQSILQGSVTLLYRQNHQRQISERKSVLPGIVVDSQDEDEEADDKILTSSSARGPTAAPDKVQTEVYSKDDSRSGTKPSTLKVEEFHKKIRNEKPIAAQQAATSIVSSTPAHGFLYPRPPKGDQLSEFVSCFLCFEPLLASRCIEARKERSASSWWRRHVDRDLTPYICLAENCANPPVAFDRRRMWTAHMIQNHTPNWAQEIHREPRWTCNIGHSTSAQFNTQNDLALHMHEIHGELFTAKQIASIVRRGSGLSVRKEGICPFQCSYDATKDLSVNSSSPGREAISSLDFSNISSGSQKRPNAATHGQSKRYRRVRFAEHTSKREDSDSSDDSTDKAQEGLRNVLENPLQRALSRHIATHLLSLSFLTIRFKELRKQDSADPDDNDSTTHLELDSSDASQHIREDSDLDAISLNFEDSGRLGDDALDEIEPAGEMPGLIDMDNITLGTSYMYRETNDREVRPQALGNPHNIPLSLLLGLSPDEVFGDVPRNISSRTILAHLPHSSIDRRNLYFYPEDWDRPINKSQEAPFSRSEAVSYVGTWMLGYESDLDPTSGILKRH